MNNCGNWIKNTDNISPRIYLSIFLSKLKSCFYPTSKKGFKFFLNKNMAHGHSYTIEFCFVTVEITFIELSLSKLQKSNTYSNISINVSRKCFETFLNTYLFIHVPIFGRFIQNNRWLHNSTMSKTNNPGVKYTNSLQDSHMECSNH